MPMMSRAPLLRDQPLKEFPPAIINQNGSLYVR